MKKKCVFGGEKQYPLVSKYEWVYIWKLFFLIVKETPTKLEKKSLVGIHIEYRSEEDNVQISNDNEQKKGKWSITHRFWGSQNGWLLLKSVLASLLF